MKFIGYRCSVCHSEYLPGQVTYVCRREGGNLDIVLDYPRLQKEALAENSEANLWRYLALLPVSDPGGIDTPLRMAGGTPVYALGRLAASLGLQNLWIKDESRNPSASFKDRASAVVVARARETGAQTVVTASTGNAGAALACMAAAVGQKAIIFAPRSAPPAKIAQLLVFGAQVLLVDGNYDDAFDLSLQASQAFGWYCRNTGYNPFTVEGKKTAAFEIWEWMKKRELRPEGTQAALAPLAIFVSVGDGNIISGLHKGFKDLFALGWLEHMPRLFGVQAEGSAAVAQAYQARTEVITPVKASTLADSISVDLPRDGLRALRAVRETGGSYLTVKDSEILGAMAALGNAGVFAEPAGAAAYAGLVTAVQHNLIRPEEAVLVFNTGSGLKDIGAALRAVPEAPVIEPRLGAVETFLGKMIQ